LIIFKECTTKIKENFGTDYPLNDHRLCTDRINLPDGYYKGLHTAYFITLDNGVTFKTVWGVRGKNIPITVFVKNGLVYKAPLSIKSVGNSNQQVQNKDKYVFIKLGEEGVTISLSDNLDEFSNFNHYGFKPTLEDLETLKKDGVVGWTGNDTWYYIMQHGAWRYMNLDLRIDVFKSIIKELNKTIKVNRL
jgi:hypothetical protein